MCVLLAVTGEKLFLNFDFLWEMYFARGKIAFLFL